MSGLVDDVVDLARASVRRDEVIAVAQRLVRIDSENPPGRTTEVCEAVADELRPAGFEIEYLEVEPGFTNVIATYAFPTPGRTLLVNGHIDVVPVGPTAPEWKHDPLGGEIDGGRLYGRGSLDMKGPVAGLLVACRSIVAAGLPLRGTLVFTAVADEEQGGKRGTGALIAAGKAQADAALVVEPSDGGITLAHRGVCFVRLTTHGRSAHASVPTNGESAVERMVDVLSACRSVKLRHEPHPLLGSPPSVAIGTTIEGGTKINVVPDRCTATLDVRHLPGMTEEGLLEDLRAHFRCTLPADGQPDVEAIMWAQSGETSPDEEIVALVIEAHEREFGETPALRGERAATDGWWFTNEARLPTIVALGPGGVAGAHIVDECVDVDGLERYSRIYADVIARFLS